MPGLPARLEDVAETLESLDRQDRIDLLIAIANRFEPMPEGRVAKPYDENHRVPGCESEVFVWGFPMPEGRMEYGFVVENPQGISAKALCALLEESLSGLKAEVALELTDDFVYRVFGRELSMGKAMGLMGIIQMVRSEARRSMSA